VKNTAPVTISLGYGPLAMAWRHPRQWTIKSDSGLVMEALRFLKDPPRKAAVYSVSPSRKKSASRGAATSAYGINPHVGIAVDVCHLQRHTHNEKKQLGDVKLGAGPVLFRGPNINPRILEELEAAAARLSVPVAGSRRRAARPAPTPTLSRSAAKGWRPG